MRSSFPHAVADFYEAYGVGMFGLNRAFRIRHLDNDVGIYPHQ